MANIINPNLRKKLHQEYILRVSTVVLLFIALSIFASALLLIPTYLNLQSDLTTINYKINELKDEFGLSDNDNESSQRKAMLVERRLMHISELKTHGFDKYLEYSFLLSRLPADLEYSSIRFTPGSEEVQPIIEVSGVATDRGALSRAIDNLEVSAWVAKVGYPLSDLSNSSNIKFSLVADYFPDQLPKHPIYNVSLEKSVDSKVNQESL